MVINHGFQSTRLSGRVLWDFPFSVMFNDIIQSNPETLNWISSKTPQGVGNSDTTDTNTI